MRCSIKLLKQIAFRNSYCRNEVKAKKHKVNLEYFNSEINLGDALSPIICDWMLQKASIDPNGKVRKTKHLMSVGSILGGDGFFDATVWGSGIMSFNQVSALAKRICFQKLDIRAVRGPLTRAALAGCGYKCPEVYGDPAILMPLIYKPKSTNSRGIGVIQHFHQDLTVDSSFKKIDIRTNDYKGFIDEVCNCDIIISSSLHGIILAESYGVPAIFFAEGRNKEMLKYYDWYYSTGRKDVIMAQSMEAALNMIPMQLPFLADMQQMLINSFPYDLWDK